MACPTCDGTMTPLGCCLVTGQYVHWCPRCGTVKPCDAETVAPDLVRRCRVLLAETYRVARLPTAADREREEGKIVRHMANVAESISTPENRP